MFYSGSGWLNFQAVETVSHEVAYTQTIAQSIPTGTDRPLGFNNAVTTTTDVTQGTSTGGSIANGKFTLNRAGMWTIDAGIRWAAPELGVAVRHLDRAGQRHLPLRRAVQQLGRHGQLRHEPVRDQPLRQRHDVQRLRLAELRRCGEHGHLGRVHVLPGLLDAAVSPGQVGAGRGTGSI
jgi:hypothetical protein